MLKRFALWLAVIGVILLLALNVGRSGRYGAMVTELEALEAEQQDWLDNNKRLIAAIAELEAPQRVEEEARERLGMERARADEVLRVELGARDGAGAGR